MRVRRRTRLPASRLFTGIVMILGCGNGAEQISIESTGVPYPASRSILGLELDWSTHRRLAPGSDNWPVTWSEDGNQYTTWGDGGGFGGTDRDGRVSLGIARIDGGPIDYVGINLHGGVVGGPAQLEGKSYGILAVDQDLYLWVSPGSGRQNYREARLHRSVDAGSTWTAAEWAFDEASGVILPTFLQCGRGYDGCDPENLFIFVVELRSPDSLSIQIPGAISLMRVARSEALDRSAYRFYAGLDHTGEPRWVSQIEDRKPVFIDGNGVGWTVSVSYNAPLDRYLLITEHGESFSGRFGLFDAPNPWGPWTTVAYDEAFGEGEISTDTFFWNFSNRWLSEDGRQFVLVFSGIGENDSWNSVEGRFKFATARNHGRNE